MKNCIKIMKKYSIFIICLLALVFSSNAQSRKYISQFSHFQSYYNPGLTGYEGSALRSFVRNQWSGFEGAPETYFMSAELDLAEMGGLEDPALMGKNAVSVNFLHDTYGAFRETELMVGYASRVRISQRHNLRLGAGINYQSIRLDGHALTTEQQNDQTLENYLGTFSDMRIFDFNLGLALTHDNYYLSSSMHNVNRGRISSGDAFMDGKPVTFMAQAGLRKSVGAYQSLIFNAFYRTQEGLPDNIELNLKSLLMDKVWIGAGHRFNYAYNLQFGLLLRKVRIGYLYELPMNKSYLLPGQTHEFTAVFNLFRTNDRKFEREILIW